MKIYHKKIRKDIAVFDTPLKCIDFHINKLNDCRAFNIQNKKPATYVAGSFVAGTGLEPVTFGL